MYRTAQAVDGLVGAALTSADTVAEISLPSGLPFVSGWLFDMGPSGLRSAQATVSVDLDRVWNQRPEIADAKQKVVEALLEEHGAALARVGLTVGQTPGEQVAHVLTRQILLRTAGLIDGSARWDNDTSPDSVTLKRSMVTEVQRFLEGEPTVADIIAPLSHCDTELTAPVVLKEGLRLVPLDAGRVTRLLSGSISAYGGVSPHEAHDWELAVVATAQPDVAGTQDLAFTQIDDAVASLRLLRQSAVGVMHHFIRPHGLSLRERGSGIHLGVATFGASLNVREADVQEIASFVSPGASTRRGRLALAMRRLQSAESRRSSEDRLIDYWVGLEALYGVGGTSEVAYRVGIRIAHALASGANAQLALFKRVKDSYNLRSAVVHGDTKRLKKVTRETASEAEGWLRASIRVWWGTIDGPGEPEVDQHLFRE